MTKYCPKCRAETERYDRGKCKLCVKSRKSAYQAAWRKANPDKVKAQRVVWRAANPEKVRADKTMWRKTNPEKIKERNARWRKTNPEKVKTYSAAYRTQMTDKYIASTIYKHNKLLKKANIQPEMIEAKRAELKLKRLIKEMQK